MLLQLLLPGRQKSWLGVGNTSAMIGSITVGIGNISAAAGPEEGAEDEDIPVPGQAEDDAEGNNDQDEQVNAMRLSHKTRMEAEAQTK
jgi:hypothetical protein